MEEKPFTNPPAFTRSWSAVSALMASGCDQAFFSPSMAAWNTAGPPMRSNRNSSHIMLVHRDCPPSEMGAMPFALNFGTRAMRSSQVSGGSTLTWSNTRLL